MLHLLFVLPGQRSYSSCTTLCMGCIQKTEIQKAKIHQAVKIWPKIHMPKKIMKMQKSKSPKVKNSNLFLNFGLLTFQAFRFQDRLLINYYDRYTFDIYSAC